jgi:hypothetical protein
LAAVFVSGTLSAGPDELISLPPDSAEVKYQILELELDTGIMHFGSPVRVPIIGTCYH